MLCYLPFHKDEKSICLNKVHLIICIFFTSMETRINDSTVTSIVQQQQKQHLHRRRLLQIHTQFMTASHHITHTTPKESGKFQNSSMHTLASSHSLSLARSHSRFNVEHLNAADFSCVERPFHFYLIRWYLYLREKRNLCYKKHCIVQFLYLSSFSCDFIHIYFLCFDLRTVRWRYLCMRFSSFFLSFSLSLWLLLTLYSFVLVFWRYIWFSLCLHWLHLMVLKFHSLFLPRHLYRLIFFKIC